MSAHDDAHGADDQDEPRTPLWLPLVGLALFLAAILYFVVSRPDAKPASELRAQSEAAAPAASNDAPAEEDH